MNIDEYCDAAKKRQNIKSDRRLCALLGKSYTTVNMWRLKKSWPNDETMVALADLAGIDPIDALLDLNIWRSHGPAIAIYTRIKTALAGTAAALLVALTVLASIPQDATARSARLVQSKGATLYIMENITSAGFNLLLRFSVLFGRVFLPRRHAPGF